MNITEQDHYYLKQEEPIRSCLLALREIILSQDKDVAAAWKYGMPFFCYKGKMFCYLWVHKKHQQAYIGFVEGKHLLHKALIQEERARMKILLMDANKDLPVKLIQSLLKQALDLYRSGLIPVK
jgi:Domain of unknown function (DU1801)